MARRKFILKDAKARSRTRNSLSGRVTLSQSGSADPRYIPDVASTIHQLEIILATVGVARSALVHQAADIDLDIATVLQRQVMEPLGEQIDRLRNLLPEKRT